MESVWWVVSPVNRHMMCYCWWPLYGFSQTSQSTLVVLGPAERRHNMQTAFNDRKVLSMISNIFLGHRASLCGLLVETRLHANKTTNWRRVASFVSTYLLKITLFLTLDLLPGRRAAVRAPPQTPGFSEPLGRWPGACGFLSPSASSHSAFASFRSLSFECLPVTEVCTPRDPLGTATQNKTSAFICYYLLVFNLAAPSQCNAVALNWQRQPRGFHPLPFASLSLFWQTFLVGSYDYVLLLSCTSHHSHTFLHAGQRPFSSVRMRCQQKRQIW